VSNQKLDLAITEPGLGSVKPGPAQSGPHRPALSE